MVRKSAIIFAIGGMLLVVLTYLCYTVADQIPKTMILKVALTIPLIVLWGMVVGWHFARDFYFGLLLELKNVNEGEYSCYKMSTGIISLNSSKRNQRFLWIGNHLGTIRLPDQIQFTLNVSTETGKNTCPGDKKPEKFTRRIFKASWTDEKSKEFQMVQWDIRI